MNAGTTSINCNAASARGTLTYTCSSGFFAPNVNSCVIPKCTGGNTSLYTVAGAKIHGFTTVGASTLHCNVAATAQVLVVGSSSGASGGSYVAGGGGGGVVIANSYSLAANGDYAVTVGDGGLQDHTQMWGLKV